MMKSGMSRRTRMAGRWAAGALAVLALTLSIAEESEAKEDTPMTPETQFSEPTYITTNGIRMAVFEEGEGFPVVFSHGFPELAYSWRHQLPALAAAGYRAIAPDQRGYGLTDRPEAVEAYTIHEICADLVGLLDALKIDKAVFCGHDWGGMVVWTMPLLYPERVAGVIGVNTPFMPRAPMAPISMLRAARGEDNYVVAFQEPGVADAALAKDVRKTFELMMRKSNLWDAEKFAELPADAPERKFEMLKMLEVADDLPGKLVLPEKALDFYVSTFKKTGFTGGINWYRNIDRNWENTAELEYKIDVPCLYVGAEDDMVLPPSMMNGMERFLPNLEKQIIKECGHWTQQEKPGELNRILLDWLGRHFGKGEK